MIIQDRTEEMERLIEKEKTFLWAQAMNIADRPEDAEDLFQDTVIKALKGCNSFQPDTNFRAWMARIMLNTHINKMRRKMSNMVPLDDAICDAEEMNFMKPVQITQMDDPEKVFFQNYINDKIMELFYSMPDEYRTAFSLFHFEGYSYEEVSRALGAPIGTIKSRIHRSRQFLMGKINIKRLAKD